MKLALRLASLIAVVLVLSACGQNVENALLTADAAYPSVISLPDGFRPEGVTIGRGHTLYAGSLGTGAVYAVDLLTGVGALAVPDQSGRIAVGMAYQGGRDRLFVAGGPGGEAYVYDATTGETVASFTLTTEASFVNDVVLSRDAAYFTDSFRPVLYVLPLAPNGALPTGAVELPLTGDYVFVPGAFNANGIEASADGSALVVVNSARAELYRVDPLTGAATLIDLGGDSVPNGDGLLLQGRTLYVVENRLNQIAVVELAPDLGSGEVVELLTDPAFDVPTTVAGFGNGLYAVNARFGTPPTPTTPYQLVRVER